MQTLKLHQRAEVWFPIIEPILKKYGIPEDFKYVPLIESGMERGQYSPKGAAGLWQFMPQTGRDYGLTVNGNIDERMNVRLATIAAAKYIKDLHKQFNSWTLAAAAYNGGEGRMWKQIRVQQQDDYFKLNLNRETGKYVYSLISMKEVIEHPEKHGYKIKNARKLLALKN
jgi:soluble lytic murein transglycosylase-like protein